MDPLARAEQLFLEALARQGEGALDAAAAGYRQALELAPGRASVMNNLAAVCVELGKIEEAKQLCERVLAATPDDEIALLNLGGCQARLGSPEQALLAYGRLLRKNSGHVDALNNRGHALLALKRQEEALASYDAALMVMPEHVDALFGRGNALMGLRREEEALASYDRAVAIQSGHADVLYNRGNTLMKLGRMEEALASYDAAIAARPGFAAALSNRALVLQSLNRREELVENYRRLVAVDPDFPYMRGYLLRSELDCCIWKGYEESIARITQGVREGKRIDSPFHFLAISDSAADQLRCARICVEDEYPPAEKPVWEGVRYRHDGIRVAYLSADFHNHAVPFLIAGLIEAHDRSRFEVTAISLGPDRQDAMRSRLRAAFDRFVDVRAKTDLEVARLLRELKVDILVDLQGYTRGCRPGILARRAAPLQVNYLGYPGTMGAPYVDYILADRHLIPPEERACYSEKVVWLPDCYQVNDDKRVIATYTPSRAELGLPQDAFVFCCFNNNYKIAPQVFDIWMRLLIRVEGSVLWLLEDNEAAARNLREEAARRGVAPGRLVFAPRMPMENHLARQRQADLFLDTLPYNAHVTASDALWAGLPLLTHARGAFAGRVACSLLNAAGLPELVTHSFEEYEAAALRLALDSPVLAEIRAKLARNRATCPLFDTNRFRRHVESAYVTMWERSRRGELPENFAVSPVS